MKRFWDFYRQFKSNLWQTVDGRGFRVDHVWSDFWMLVIAGGFRFRDDELLDLRASCQAEYGSSYYGCGFYGPQEGHYSTAVMVGNISFCRAYEVYVKRKPFIGVGLDYYNRYYERHTPKGTTSKEQGRLIIGARFQWEGERVTVTSFKDGDEAAIVACAYHPRKDAAYEDSSKIKRRFTITHDAWQKEMRERRKAGKESA